MKIVLISLAVLALVVVCTLAHPPPHHHHHHGHHDDDDDDEVAVPYQRCIVASTSTSINCSSVFNASLLNPDPYFISDGPVYPTLQMALDDCPFSPVLIEIHGTVLASDNLTYSQNKDLFIRGVLSPQNPSKIVRFSNVHIVHTNNVLEFEGLILEGCQANHSLFTSDGIDPCLTEVDIVFVNSVVQNYNGSVLVCHIPPVSCSRHELIAVNSEFLNITGDVIYTQNVADVSIVRNYFCPRYPGSDASYLTVISSGIFEIIHNTFCGNPTNNTVDFIV